MGPANSRANRRTAAPSTFAVVVMLNLHLCADALSLSVKAFVRPAGAVSVVSARFMGAWARLRDEMEKTDTAAAVPAELTDPRAQTRAQEPIEGVALLAK